MNHPTFDHIPAINEIVRSGDGYDIQVTSVFPVSDFYVINGYNLSKSSTGAGRGVSGPRSEPAKTSFMAYCEVEE